MPRAGTDSMTDTEFVVCMRAALGRFERALAAYFQDHGSEPAAGSQAALERASFPRAESLVTVTAIGTMLVESVGDHVSTFLKTMCEPVEIIAGWTCVRSMLETSAIAAWLYDPRIAAQERVARAYAYRYEGLEQQLKFARSICLPPVDMAKIESVIDKLANDAAALGYSDILDKNGRRIGVAMRTPKATEMIAAVLDEEPAYRLLSAMAHGHTWAIQQLGFRVAAVQPSPPADGVVVTAMEKSAGTLHGYAYLVLRAAKALGFPVWNQARYFGWDVPRLTTILEDAYDDFKAKPNVRFWN